MRILCVIMPQKFRPRRESNPDHPTCYHLTKATNNLYYNF